MSRFGRNTTSQFFQSKKQQTDFYLRDFYHLLQYLSTSFDKFLIIRFTDQKLGFLMLLRHFCKAIDTKKEEKLLGFSFLQKIKTHYQILEKIKKQSLVKL